MAARRKRVWHPKSNERWNAMAYSERREWIGELDDAQILRQAEVRAAAAGRTVASILTAWVLNGYLGFERKLALVFTLEAAPADVRTLPDGSVWIDGELVTLPTAYNTAELRDLIDEREQARARGL